AQPAPQDAVAQPAPSGMPDAVGAARPLPAVEAPPVEASAKTGEEVPSTDRSELPAVAVEIDAEAHAHANAEAEAEAHVDAVADSRADDTAAADAIIADTPAGPARASWMSRLRQGLS